MPNDSEERDIWPVLERLAAELGELREAIVARQVAEARMESNGLQPAAFNFPRRPFDKPGTHESSLVVSRQSRPALPDPRLIRQIIALRQSRNRFFENGLFADPAWDMLLDLTAAHAEFKRVSVTSLCIASGVPPTTALRWINRMIELGIFCRQEDPIDARRAFVLLTDEGAEAVARYFADAGLHVALPI